MRCHVLDTCTEKRRRYECRIRLEERYMVRGPHKSLVQVQEPP